MANNFRNFASAPTLDSERRSLLNTSSEWSPTKINIFNHTISVDITTGNIVIGSTDLSYPYYNHAIEVSRAYDAQEQWMQIEYLRNFPNVDPKPHWFGNWKFSYEADIEDVWHPTYSEVQVSTSAGLSGLFDQQRPYFHRNFYSPSEIESNLRRFGIPIRTLKSLDTNFREGDLLLRTFMGKFTLLAGRFLKETAVDKWDADLWLFDPIHGSGTYITSSFSYKKDSKGKNPKVGHPIVLAKSVDALGHSLELRPESEDHSQFILIDGSDRRFTLKLNQVFQYADGNNPSIPVSRRIISNVVDETFPSNNEYEYSYAEGQQLQHVSYPFILDGQRRHIIYHYDDPEFPGIISGIENLNGDEVKFEYQLDPNDLDERLNPRLKIKRILVPEDIIFEYSFDVLNKSSLATIQQKENIDREISYQYIRDTERTKKRFISSIETNITRGYFRDNAGALKERAIAPRKEKSRTFYSEDGRFNIKKQSDPLDRANSFEYNDFNQVEISRDFEGRVTKNIYDIPNSPTKNNPIRYDLLSFERENIIRTIEGRARNITEEIKSLKKTFTYHRYNANNSIENNDHGRHSTHRLFEEIDELGRTWTSEYDDRPGNLPIEPTLITSHLGNTSQSAFDNRGYLTSNENAEGEKFTFEINDQGIFDSFTDPNNNKTVFEYYAETIFLHKITDVKGNISELLRTPIGLIESIVDPLGDSVEYLYYSNLRPSSLIEHRPRVSNSLSNPAFRTTNHNNLETYFEYSALGALTYIKNPAGQEVSFKLDEAGRLYSWLHESEAPLEKRFLYNPAGQLLERIDVESKSTTFSYDDDSGLITKTQHPSWDNGAENTQGKELKYSKYDYLGNPLTIEDSELSEGNTEYIYNEVGNLIVRRDPDGFELIFSYDGDHRLENVVDRSGNFLQDLLLDKIGRVKTLKDSNALDRQMTCKYDYKNGIKVGNLFKRTISSIGLETEFDYTTINQLESLGHFWNGPPRTKIYDRTFSYREDGLLEEIRNSEPNKFLYDGIKQLVYEDTTKESMDYDKAGNRLYRMDRDLKRNPGENEFEFPNRIKKETEHNLSLTYDGSGNLKTLTQDTDPDILYFFDGTDRLRIVRNSLFEINYIYDFEGKLTKRSVLDKASGATDNFSFHYYDSRPVIVKKNGNLFRIFTWDQTDSLLRTRRPEIIGTGRYPNSLFSLGDGHNTPVLFVDDAKNIQIQISYSAWGNITAKFDPNNLLEMIGYNSSYSDPLTQLNLFGVRWYFPDTGTFISEDPIINSGANPAAYPTIRNLYRYANNSPSNLKDSSGLHAEGINQEQAEELEALFQDYRKKVKILQGIQDQARQFTKNWAYRWNQRTEAAEQEISRIKGALSKAVLEKTIAWYSYNLKIEEISPSYVFTGKKGRTVSEKALAAYAANFSVGVTTGLLIATIITGGGALVILGSAGSVAISLTASGASNYALSNELDELN